MILGVLVVQIPLWGNNEHAIAQHICDVVQNEVRLLHEVVNSCPNLRPRRYGVARLEKVRAKKLWIGKSLRLEVQTFRFRKNGELEAGVQSSPSEGADRRA